MKNLCPPEVFLNFKAESYKVCLCYNLLMTGFVVVVVGVCLFLFNNMKKSSPFLSRKYIKTIWSALYNNASVDMRAYTSQHVIILMCFPYTIKPSEGFYVCTTCVTHWLQFSAESRNINFSVEKNLCTAISPPKSMPLLPFFFNARKLYVTNYNEINN